jgi:ABC-2 type transport system permease protein
VTITLTPSVGASRGTLAERLRGPLQDVWSMTRRNLIHVRREPMQLSDVTIQPILFTLLFIYVFGSDIQIPGGYKAFALAGLLLLNLTTSTMGTAVGIATDLHEGAIDRFRTLPMWRSAVLVGRSIADLLTAAVCTTIVVLTGLVVGWRPHTGVLSFVAAFAIALLFAYSLSWMAMCAGLNADNAESAQSFGFIFLFPVAFISNALVSTGGMPAWLRDFANWNPVSAVTSAVRHLLGNPNPSASSGAWPMQHPIEAALLWSLVIFVVFAPLAAYLFRRKTTE